MELSPFVGTNRTCYVTKFAAFYGHQIFIRVLMRLMNSLLGTMIPVHIYFYRNQLISYSSLCSVFQLTFLVRGFLWNSVGLNLSYIVVTFEFPANYFLAQLVLLGKLGFILKLPIT
jgi:hypothetical protein